MTSSGCGALELAQLPHERVELGVAELGIVVHEVPLGVVLDQIAQRSCARSSASAGTAFATIRDLPSVRTPIGAARQAPMASLVAAA